MYKSAVWLEDNNCLTLDKMKSMLAPRIEFLDKLPNCLHVGIDSQFMILVDPMKSCGASHYGGHVKSPTMFMVMATDDLVVTSMSPVSVMSLLNRFNTSSDLKEGIVIFNAALTSTSALCI